MTFARINVFNRGLIVAHSEHGLTAKQICKRVVKKDGKRPKPRAVQKTICKKRLNPEWQGENAPGGPGRKPSITPEHAKALEKLIFQERGKAYCTMRYCKQRLPCLRKYSRFVLAYALHGVGLKWLRRRSKRKVLPSNLQPRIDWAKWVLLQIASFFLNFAFIDGSTFYLARSVQEKDDQERKALGQFTWRMSSCADGLYNDNVGPSLYAAHQGQPVKIWGFLANGKLCYHVLPARGRGTTHMNGLVFRHMIETYGAKWIRTCWPNRRPRRVQIIMDWERCLRTDESLECLREHCMHAVPNYPKSSGDLNSIENVWHHLKGRLDETAPSTLESRPDFLIRLRAAIQHLNTTKAHVLQQLCRDQMKRAQKVINNDGGRIDM